MKVVIAGGSGFLGQVLISELAPVASEIVVLSTGVKSAPGARTVKWDGISAGDWQKEIEGAEAVVNYCGASIFSRWTPENRAKILSSRELPTRALGLAIATAKKPPAVWINGSAIGYYGDPGPVELTEASAAGKSFLADVTVKWEAAAKSFEPDLKQTKLVLLRTGVALDAAHPPLSLLIRLTKNFAGGSVGNGDRYMPWIYARDHARLVRHAIEHRLEGPLNAVAPEPITNGDMMSQLRKALGRPWSPPMPTAVIKVLGKLGFPDESVLSSIRAVPAKAISSGFSWVAPSFQQVLAEVGLAHR